MFGRMLPGKPAVVRAGTGCRAQSVTRPVKNDRRMAGTHNDL
jgi:hypothetical protein